MASAWSRFSSWSLWLRRGNARTRRNSRLGLQRLETRETPAFAGGVSVAAGMVGNNASFVTGAGAGGSPMVQIFDAAGGKQTASFMGLDASFTGGLSVAVGKIDGTGGSVIVGAGPGGSPIVNIFDAQGNKKSTFTAFEDSFRGGVRVAAGDVDGDGLDDIIVGAGPGSTPHIRVFSGANQSIIRDFMAFDPKFIGGVTVASTDLTGDGRADIVVGADAGGVPVVQVFDGVTSQAISAFYAFDPRFTGGAYVSAAGGRIIVGAGVGGVPVVQQFDVHGNPLLAFFADSNLQFSGGIWTAATDYNGDGLPEIMTGAGPGGDPTVSVYNGLDLAPLTVFDAFDPNGTGGNGIGPMPTTDTTVPTVTITAPTDGQTFTTNPTITATATDNVAVTSVEASVDAGDFVTASFDSSTGTVSFTPTLAVDGTANGSHTVSIRAKDAAGNVSALAAITFTLAIDVTAPTVTLTSPPAGQSFLVNPTIEGTASDNIKVNLVEVSVDGGTFTSITFDSSSGAFSFTTALPLDNGALGSHTVNFRATDTAGNTSSVASLTFTLAADMIAPTVTLNSPADGQSFVANPTIQGKVTDNVHVTLVEASVDGGAFKAISFDATTGAFNFTTNLPTDNSATGSHTVDFRATDAAGNVSTLATRTFTLEADTVAPTVVINSPADGQSFFANPTFKGIATDNGKLTRLQVSVDGGMFNGLMFNPTTGAFEFTTSLPLNNTSSGSHTVAFRAADEAGNNSAPVSLTFTLALDTVAPTIAITEPADGQTFVENPTIKGNAADNVAVALVEVSIDGGAFSSVTFNTTTGAFSFTTDLATNGTADGAHTAVFRATDAAGNVSTPATLNITINSSFGITAALDESSDTGTPGNNITELTTVTLMGTTRPNAVVSVVGTVVSTTADDVGNYVLSGVTLVPGANTLTVRATVDGVTRDTTLTVFQNAAPTVAGPVIDINVPKDSAATVLNLPQIFSDADVNSLIQFNTNFGTFEMELFDQQVAATVANFLNYVNGTTVNGGNYVDTIFHRVTRITQDAGTNDGIAVLQGGGYKFTSEPSALNHIPADPAIALQALLSNANGTVAMARTGAPDSATSEFFINTADNRSLDRSATSDGYAVFGAIRAGRSVVDALYAVPEQDFGSPFSEIPLQNYTSTGNFPADTQSENYELVNSVTVLRQASAANPDALTFTVVDNSNPALVNLTLNGSTASLAYTPGQSGQATITLRATDRNGANVDVTFTVTVS